VSFLEELISALACSRKDSALRAGLQEVVSGGPGSHASRFLLEKATQLVFTFVPGLAPLWSKIYRALAMLVP
jgi:hypothetical protein